VVVGSVGEMTDNGRPGSDHRLYSAGSASGNVAVVSGETDMVLRWVRVGDEPVALAWNPAHSWVYVANHESSSITVVRDTLMLGVAENRPQASSRRLQTTIVGGVLVLVAAGSRQNAGSRAELLDATGRKVADLKPGANDVRALAPGVYFVRRLETGDGRPVAVIEKVVVTR
jgi:hypothetical protein